MYYSVDHKSLKTRVCLMEYSMPQIKVIDAVVFASWGYQPKFCGNLQINPNCHGRDSAQVVYRHCVGRKECRIPGRLTPLFSCSLNFRSTQR